MIANMRYGEKKAATPAKRLRARLAGTDKDWFFAAIANDLAERRAALAAAYDAEAATLTMSGITGTCSGNGWPGCWV